MMIEILAMTFAEAAVLRWPTDGDSFRHGGNSYRLAGIDAPEMRQWCERKHGPYPCGDEARLWLRGAAKGGLKCMVVGRGKYRRFIVRCWNKRGDVGEQMVRQGWARAYVRYGGAIYLPAEREARAKRRGIWAGRHVAPWAWRRR